MKYLTLCLLAVFCLSLSAQETSDDSDFSLDLFEKSPVEEAPDISEGLPEEAASDEQDGIIEQKGLFSLFLENIHGSTELFYSGFPSSLKADPLFPLEPRDTFHTLSSHSEVKSSTGKDRWRFNMDVNLDFGVPLEDYHSIQEDPTSFSDWLQDRDRQVRFLSAREVYFSLFLDKWDLHAGKKIITNSIARIYSPADIYSRSNSIDPFNASSRGRYLVEGDYYFNNSSLSAVILPVYQWGKYPDPLSRWRYYGTAEQSIGIGWLPADRESLYAEQYAPVEISPENISYLLKWKSTFSGADVFASAFYGLNTNQVTNVSLTPMYQVEMRHAVIPVVQGAAGLTTTYGGWGFTGEGLYNYSLESKDDDYLQYSLGTSYLLDGFSEEWFLEKVEWIAEYAGEWLIRKQSHPDFNISTEEQRTLKNDILLSCQLDFKPDLQLLFFEQFDWKDRGGSTTLTLTYDGIENLELSLGGQLFYGTRDSDYDLWKDNNRVMAKVTCFF